MPPSSRTSASKPQLLSLCYQIGPALSSCAIIFALQSVHSLHYGLSRSLCSRRSVGHFHFLQLTLVVQNLFNHFTASRCTNTLLFYAASTPYSTLQPSLPCTFHARRLLDEYPIFAFSRTYASSALSAPRALSLTCSLIQSLSLILPYHIATLP